MVILYLVVTCEENIARDTGQDDGGPEIIGYICFFMFLKPGEDVWGAGGRGTLCMGKVVRLEGSGKTLGT